MGMRDFFFFFFFFSVLAQGRAKKTQRTSGRCQDELTEIVEGRPHFSFFFGGGLNLEQVLAYRKCGEGIALFFFFAV